MLLRKKLIRLAYQRPELRSALLPLLTKVREQGTAVGIGFGDTIPPLIKVAKSIEVDQALRMKKLKLSDLAPKPGKKADLRYFKKVRIWRIQQAYDVLKGKIPEDRLKDFLEDTANGYAVHLLEERRRKWPTKEEDVYKNLVDPKSKDNGLWPQMKSALRYYGETAQDLKKEAEALLEGKSDMQLLEAGLLSSVLGDFHISKLLEMVRRVDHMDEDRLSKLIAALQKV